MALDAMFILETSTKVLKDGQGSTDRDDDSLDENFCTFFCKFYGKYQQVLDASGF